MRFFFVFFLFCGTCLSAQNPSFQSYITGDSLDVVIQGQRQGVVLMGGNTENDHAMRWFLRRAGGGDVLVLRASGGDAYNNYLYSDLGVSVHSVQTIVTLSAEGAADPYVVRQVRNAEAIWLAGGDQAKYVQWWKDSPLGDALRSAIAQQRAIVGGTSAGMAILGDFYFSALNGSVTSSEALANPYDDKVTLGGGDFLQHPLLTGVITDTHYDARNRKGRHVAWMARIMRDYNVVPLGIAAEEYTAICIDSLGEAHVFGRYPQQPDFAWFLRVNCENPFMGPESCTAGKPLHWLRNKAAIRALKVPATQDGRFGLSLSTWKTPAEVTSENWWVEEGVLHSAAATGALPCLTNTSEIPRPETTHWSFQDADYLNLTLEEMNLPAVIRLFDLHGRLLREWHSTTPQDQYRLPDTVKGGSYILSITGKKDKISRMVVLNP